MDSKRVVTPVETGVQRILDQFKKLDSGFRRNDMTSAKRCFGFLLSNKDNLRFFSLFQSFIIDADPDESIGIDHV